jgi:hypothetical protein
MITGGLLLLLAIGATTPSVESLYEAARRYDKGTLRFAPPPTARLARMRDLARILTVEARMAKPEPSEADRAKARALGLSLELGRDAGGALWILREAGKRRSGDGFFAWRPGGRELCVQAPHSFFDEGTGPIALTVFAEVKALAFFGNTIHRHAPVAAGSAEDAADVAHAAATLFQAATEGLLEAGPVAVVQVHGFGPRENLPAGTAAVVSDGVPTRADDAPAARLRAALRETFGGPVLLYGVDARELGATTNVQGRSARAAGAIFLHVEMSAATRADRARAGHGIAKALDEALPKPR